LRLIVNNDMAGSFRQGRRSQTRDRLRVRDNAERATISGASRALSSVPGPGALARRRGRLCECAATIAPPAHQSEPKSAQIDHHPRLLPRFQALVPETERDSRRFSTTPCRAETGHVRALSEMELAGQLSNPRTELEEILLSPYL
jgi:hypothetical protein